ncbi:MAG: tRNA (N(6)-L-threonylcarbamoyladenosine(37)-C(2))-methylthiotransferase MtaB [Muribaculaceae bacterium]|nr:tRNA (N(6)-L-threonylcarbamoyladenosine(37)-C(2))-methylthiotransferase MtaB [Muribaculaceae bacterium]
MTPDYSGRKIAYFTLGCKLNFAETSTIGRMLSERGYRRAEPFETPDMCVVNTCSVTETADKKGRSLIRRLVNKWPEATIVVTGCYAQLKPEEVSGIEGVDIVLGSNEKLRLTEYLDRWERTHTPIMDTTPSLDIKSFRPSCERGDRTRWWLKVQDGCDYFCTYCTIPFARGRSRSGNTDELVAQALHAAGAGAKEIVLTGVNIGEFGRDNGQDFLTLLKRLDEVEGIERYRISSIEPNLLTEEILRWMASESRAFKHHFHIPLQSGSDRVLRLMNRRYDTSLFRERVECIRELMPDAFIGVDVIAGARGETQSEWERSVEYIDSLDVTRLHVFPYSERPGTKALLLGDVVENGERHRRVGILSEISERKMRDFMVSAVGQRRDVLWEHKISGSNEMSGLTDNYLRVSAPYLEGAVNTITPVLITGLDNRRPETVTGEHAG